MKPRKLSALINVPAATLRTWAGITYREYLSPSGQGMNGAARSFSDTDSRVLAWVATLRGQNISVAEIHLTLRQSQADNWRNLPPLPGGMANDEPIAVIPREAANERLSAIEDRYALQVQALTKERDSALALVGDLRERLTREETENARLQKRADSLTDQVIEINKHLAVLLAKEQKRRK